MKVEYHFAQGATLGEPDSFPLSFARHGLAGSIHTCSIHETHMPHTRTAVQRPSSYPYSMKRVRMQQLRRLHHATCIQETGKTASMWAYGGVALVISLCGR